MTDYPDFTVIARLKGEYAGVEKSVVLDSEGALQALLYGTYSGANKKILVDTDGNVRMNLYAQDLEEMVNRFKYGAPNYQMLQVNMDQGVWDDMFTITGKGFIYFNSLYLIGSISHALDVVRVWVDGERFWPLNFAGLDDYHFINPDEYWLALRLFDDNNFRYRVSITNGWTFETTYQQQYFRQSANNCNIYCDTAYTLI